jgi:PBSX family phage terminase large subunit
MQGLIHPEVKLPSWSELAESIGMDLEDFRIKPFTFNQMRALYESEKPFNLWEGAIRSGKTFLSLAWLIEKISTLPRGNGMLLGQTPETMERNFINDLMDILGEGNYHYVKGKYIDVFYTDRHSGEYRRRRLFIVGAKNKDAIRRVRGSTLMIAYIDEVTLIPQDVFDELVGRLSYKESICLSTTNPDHPKHWLLKEYVEHPKKMEDWSRHKFTLDDNIALSEDYKERLKRQYMGIPARYQRMILGRWVIADGVIYQVFDTKKHVLKKNNLGKARRYKVACDYGDQNATVFLLIGEYRDKKNRKVYLVEKEYYYSGRDTKISKTVTQFVDDFEAWLPKDVRISEIIIDPSAKALAREFEARRFMVTKAKNNVLEGIGETANLIYNDQFYVMDSCTNTINEFGIYVWDPKAAARGEDAPLKDNDHCLDAARYFVMDEVA